MVIEAPDRLVTLIWGLLYLVLPPFHTPPHSVESETSMIKSYCGPVQVTPGQRRSTDRFEVEVEAAIFPAARVQPGGGHVIEPDAGPATPSGPSSPTTNAATLSVLRLMVPTPDDTIMVANTIGLRQAAVPSMFESCPHAAAR